ERFGYRMGHEDGADRKSAAQRLAQHGDVGLHAVLLVGEERAGAAHAALHLVDHEGGAQTVGALAQALQELLAGRHHAAFALHGLDDDGADVRIEMRVDIAQVIELGEANAGNERLEWRAVRRRVRGGYAESEPAMEATLEGEDVAARKPERASAGSCELEGGVEPLAAGVAIEH